MLLVHASSLASLRRELLSTIGREQTRRLLLRAGFASGRRDAELARKVRPNAPFFEAFAVGPQLHMLEGSVQVTPQRFEYEPDANHYLGIYRWDHSWEAESHLRDFGPQEEPVCWMLLGYASGYTTEFFGRPVYYKEMACQGCGGQHCLIEGRLAQQWPDAQSIAQDYDSESMLLRLDKLQSEVEVLRTQLQPEDDLGPLIGRSPSFSRAIELLRKAAPTQVTVMLTGETGVGKERFARALHALSPRKDNTFIAVNCGALPAELVESELFGVEKGAFTGAQAARPGRFERAQGGTLFLDELGELPLAAQAKLLRVLQSGEIERLGGTQALKVDVRVVAATNVDLDAAVTSGRFRRDLLFRLNVYPIRIPALSERVDDIEPLAIHLLERFSALHGKQIPGFSDQALEAMRHHDWPGNIREMENLIERGVILGTSGQRIELENLFPALPSGMRITVSPAGSLERSPGSGAPEMLDLMKRHGMTLNDLEDALMSEAVQRHRGNVSAAARELGLTRPQLSYRLEKMPRTD